MKNSFKTQVKTILQEKCPKCGESHVFHKSHRFLQIPEMKKSCSTCGYHFEREPGFFIGAMYVSYGLTVLEGILTFLLMRLLFPGAPELVVIGIICALIVALSMKNFRLSRMIWMNLFLRY